VRATLIDFTLSRCCVSTSTSTSTGADEVVFDPFEDDDLFEGEGEYQFEVYRRMRALVEGAHGGKGEKAWRASEPRTNVLVRLVPYSLLCATGSTADTAASHTL